MKVSGLLCWYDESPVWLAAAVTAASRLCDQIVAVDGAYAMFPHGRAQSDPYQAEAILHAAYAAGVGCLIHRPAETWAGNQIEKRTTMFNLAAQISEPDDWVFVFDADDLVTHVPADAKDRLSAAAEHVAAYTLWWTQDVDSDPTLAAAARQFTYPHEAANRYFRGLFRALPDLRVEDAHYHVLAGTAGTTVHLRGHPDVAPFLNLTDLRVQHRHPQRTRARLETSAVYDRLVREFGLEVPAAELEPALAGREE